MSQKKQESEDILIAHTKGISNFKESLKKIISNVNKLEDQDHIIIKYSDYSKLIDIVKSSIIEAITTGYAVVLIMTKKEMDNFEDQLSKKGFDINELLQNDVFIKINVEDINSGRELVFSFDVVADYLDSIVELAESENFKGIHIIATMADKLVKSNQPEVAIKLEKSWQRYIQDSTFPISLVCPYKAIDEKTQEELKKSHSSVFEI